MPPTTTNATSRIGQTAVSDEIRSAPVIRSCGGARWGLLRTTIQIVAQ
jgi:hypothetical protein